MTAIAHRDMAGFVRQAILYVGVFAATTAVAVLYRFTEERLGLLWRSWLTRRVTERYLDGRTYLRLKESAEIDNPDQRIAEDTRAFTTTTLSFTLIFLNSILAAISFSGVLWTISPLLFGVALGYAALGTLATVLLGRPLVGLNYRQSDREADFRAALIHVRENAESVALLHREDRLRVRLLSRIDELVANFRRITSVNRNLGFFTTGYNYLIQIIPTLIVAPRFIRGEVEFGVITQSAMAFTQLLGAFSLIINQFGSISSFAAVVARLQRAGGGRRERRRVDGPGIETVEDRDRLAYERLTLRPPGDDGPLLADVSVSIPRGTRVLVTGPNEAACVALFRATAGIWPHGEGRIIRPPLDAILFLPQQPYLTPGTLRRPADSHRAGAGHFRRPNPGSHPRRRPGFRRAAGRRARHRARLADDPVPGGAATAPGHPTHSRPAVVRAPGSGEHRPGAGHCSSGPSGDSPPTPSPTSISTRLPSRSPSTSTTRCSGSTPTAPGPGTGSVRLSHALPPPEETSPCTLWDAVPQPVARREDRRGDVLVARYLDDSGSSSPMATLSTRNRL